MTDEARLLYGQNPSGHSVAKYAISTRKLGLYVPDIVFRKRGTRSSLDSSPAGVCHIRLRAGLLAGGSVREYPVASQDICPGECDAKDNISSSVSLRLRDHTHSVTDGVIQGTV